VPAQRLPTNTDQAVFKALQTYSNGDIVRWIDPVVSGQPAPDHPTPILQLTAAGGGATATTASSPPQVALNTSKLAKQSSVDTAIAIAIAGLAVGVTGLAVAIIALAGRRRPIL
jgi:Domain of unkown function (DUF1775)